MSSRLICFLSCALLSNICAAAINVAIIWCLATPSLPSWIIMVHQLLYSLGLILGAHFAPKLSMSGKHPCTLVRQVCCCEAVAAALVGGILLMALWRTSIFFVLAVSVVSFWVACLVGAGGPSWIQLVSISGVQEKRNKRIGADSAQFQIGRAVGPVIGTLALQNGIRWIWILVSLNVISYLVSGWMSGRLEHLEQHVSVDAHKIECNMIRRKLKIWQWLAFIGIIIVITISADGLRAYIPRRMRSAGAGVNLYGMFSTVGALGGVLAGILVTVWSREGTHFKIIRISMLTIAAGLSCWALTSVTTYGMVIGVGLVAIGSVSFYVGMNQFIFNVFDGISARIINAKMSSVRSLGGMVGVILGAFISNNTMCYIWIFSALLLIYLVISRKLWAWIEPLMS